MTFKDLVNTFEQAATEHVGVNTFRFGTLDKLDQSVSQVYPYMFLRPMSTSFPEEGERQLSFELYVIDVPRLDDETALDVMSQSETTLYDVFSYFKTNPNTRDIEIEVRNIVPVNEAFADRVYGWMASIDVTTPYSYDFCNYPNY